MQGPEFWAGTDIKTGYVPGLKYIFPKLRHSACSGMHRQSLSALLILIIVLLVSGDLKVDEECESKRREEVLDTEGAAGLYQVGHDCTGIHPKTENGLLVHCMLHTFCCTSLIIVGTRRDPSCTAGDFPWLALMDCPKRHTLSSTSTHTASITVCFLAPPPSAPHLPRTDLITLSHFCKLYSAWRTNRLACVTRCWASATRPSRHFKRPRLWTPAAPRSPPH